MSGPAYCLVRGVIHFNHKDCRNWCAVWNVQCRLYLMDCKCSKWVWMCLQHVGDERTFFWISLFKILNSMGIYMQHSGPKQHRVITWRIHGHRALLCGIDSPAWSVCSLVFCEKAVFFFFFFLCFRVRASALRQRIHKRTFTHINKWFLFHAGLPFPFVVVFCPTEQEQLKK